MAFNFNYLNQTLGKTNIFGSGTPNEQDPLGQQNMFRTSAPGLAAPTPGPTGGAPAVAARTQPMTAPNQAAAAYAGVRGTDTTKAIGGIQGNIQGAQDKLQAKANEYGAKIETAKAENGLAPDVVDKAIAGDDKAFQETAGRLSQSGAKTVDTFEGLKDEDLPTLVDPLRTQETWGEIFRPQAGPQYTAGQSNMEDLLLGRNKGFASIARALGNQEDTLLQTNKDMAGTETKKAQESLDADWTAKTDAIRSQLTGASEQVIADLKAREAAEETRRAGLSEYLAQDEIVKGLSPRLEQILRDSGYGDQTGLLNDTNQFNGLTDYISMNRDVDYKDLVTEDDAKKFNRINGLLGNGDMLTAGRGTPADYDYDQTGGNAYLQSVLTGKAKDAKQLADIQTQAEAQRKKEADEAAMRAMAAKMFSGLSEEVKRRKAAAGQPAPLPHKVVL